MRHPKRTRSSLGQIEPIGTLHVAKMRSAFLSAALKIAPEAIMELFGPETIELARRNFNPNRTAEPCQALSAQIEKWATKYHLAEVPIINWWIFPIACDELADRVYPTNPEEEAPEPFLGVPVKFLRNTDVGLEHIWSYAFWSFDPTSDYQK